MKSHQSFLECLLDHEYQITQTRSIVQEELVY
jgi:hypothetical protein